MSNNDQRYMALLEQAQETSRALAALAAVINDPAQPLKRGALASQVAQMGADLAGHAYPTMVSDGRRMPVSASPSSNESMPQELVKYSNSRQPKSITPAERRHRAKRSRAQDHAVQLALDGAPIVKINAGAGTGKTTTLIWVAEEKAGRGLYVAYNRDVQRDAKERFPSHVATYTAHALAHAQVGGPWRAGGKEIRNIRVEDIRRLLQLQGEDAAASRLYAIRETFNAFLNTPDLMVTETHVPTGLKERIGRELRGQGMPALAVEQTVLAHSEMVALRAQQVWEAVSDRHSDAPLPHDAYLKIWVLSSPRIEADYILLDEAQDTTPIVQSLFSQQDAPLILVGDRWQAIYQYRGAKNAMANMGGEEANLRESYRFGQSIADAANLVLQLRGEKNLLIGAGSDASRVDIVDRSKPYTVIARSNATLCARAAAICTEAPTAVVGGSDELVKMLKSGYALFTGNKGGVTHPAFAAINTYKELQDIVQSKVDNELGPIVSIIESHGAGTRGVINSLENGLVAEDKAHVVLTTAHKAKGREWDQVELAEDFPAIRDHSGRIRDEEANILYVAATRARKVLSPCRTLLELAPQVGGAHLLKGASASRPDIAKVDWAES